MPAEPFNSITGIASALPNANIDTDVIMPKAFLKGTDRSGLSHGVFHDLRFDADGRPKTDFILNSPERAGTNILVVGPNFGCGSSREHAIWGLIQLGIRVIIGTSFAGIFSDNALNNGLLLIRLSEEKLESIIQTVVDKATNMTVDLVEQKILLEGKSTPFDIDPIVKELLLSGTDRIGTALKSADRIRSFEQKYFEQNPWLLEKVGK